MMHGIYSTTILGWALTVLLIVFVAMGDVSFVSASSAGRSGSSSRSSGGSVSYSNGFSVSNVRAPAGGGGVGRISSCSGSCYAGARTGSSVMYSRTLSSPGRDVWVSSGSCPSALFG